MTMKKRMKKLDKDGNAAAPAGPAPSSSAGDSAPSAPPAEGSADPAADPTVYPNNLAGRSIVSIIRAGFKCKKKSCKPTKKDEMAAAKPKPNYGKVIVKEPKARGPGKVIMIPPKVQSPGKVIMKSVGSKFGINPKALSQKNAASALASAAKKAPAQAPATHVAGVEIPAQLAPHFHAGQVIPYDHPQREEAAKFVTQVWRKDQAEGRRMSDKLLGIGENGKETNPNVKPGYATMKIEPGETTNPPAKEQSAPPAQMNKAEDGNAAKKLGHADTPNSGGVQPPTEKPYNPRLERPNQRARVADVKAKLMAAAPEGGHDVSLSTTNSKLAKDGVASFNLVPIETCPGAGSCAKYCYADTGSYLRFHKTTMPPRVKNWLASQREDFVPKMIAMIDKEKKKGKIKAIRVHDSGDFYSPQYIDKWDQIAKAHPDMKFYAYTKSHHPNLRARLNELEKNPNFNIVQSFGSKYDHLIDPNKPHAVVFPSKESMDRAGYADAMETDLTASDKNNTKVGLYIHGQYDKSYPGLKDHVKANPKVAKDIEEKLGSLYDTPYEDPKAIKKSEKPTLRRLLKKEA